jgi:hypothetical protein
VVTGRKGRQGVTFASDGATVSWTLPTLTINGVIYGARSMEYAGQIDFVDATNGLRATLVFDSESVKVQFRLSTLGEFSLINIQIRRSMIKTRIIPEHVFS